MAFRIEKRITAVLIWAAALAGAQPLTFQVRHEHLRGGAAGTLSIDADSVSFQEQAKEGKHSREWRYEDIQQLSLSSGTLRILTYDDQKWQLGRDRDFVFDRLGEGLVTMARPLFEAKLGRRFVASLADEDLHVLWQAGVKLRHGLSGSQGALLVGDDRIVYQSHAAGESRTWRFEDIDSISTGGPFDLTITTGERSPWRHAGPTEFRFQLKEELAENRYNDLWRGIYQSKAATGRSAAR
jgi:hypothetical protein